MYPSYSVQFTHEAQWTNVRDTIKVQRLVYKWRSNVSVQSSCVTAIARCRTLRSRGVGFVRGVGVWRWGYEGHMSPLIAKTNKSKTCLSEVKPTYIKESIYSTCNHFIVIYIHSRYMIAYKYVFIVSCPSLLWSNK